MSLKLFNSNDWSNWMKRKLNTNDKKDKKHKRKHKIHKKIKDNSKNLIIDFDLGYSEMSQNVKNMLQQIKDLQEKEEELFIELENNNDSEEKELLLEQINSISTQRISIYNNLKILYNGNLKNSINTNNTLKEQNAIIDNIENELNEQKEKINKKNQEFINKLRLVQNNTYYSKKYTDQAQLLITLIILCIILIAISLLRKIEIIPTTLITLLIVLVLFIGIIIVYRKIMDMSLRNNLDYDTYDFPFNKENIDKKTMEVIMNEYVDETETLPVISTNFYAK
jgi:hypothetical protein